MTRKSSGLAAKSWRALALASTLALGSTAITQAAENHTGAWGLISSMGSQNPYDAYWLATGDPTDPIVHNNLIYVNMDMQYNYPSYEAWESATWRPASKYPTQRFPASLQGTTNLVQPLEGRYIQLRNLTIERTDLDAQNVQFRFMPISGLPGNTSLTLKDGSLTGLNGPLFSPDALFTLSASGDSSITNWWERVNVRSSTTMNVTGAGSKLSFYRVGKPRGVYWEALYFDGANNTATIDGATLMLDQSSITFGKPNPTPNPYGQMTFQNGATLELVGPETKLESGNVSFVKSSLKFGLGGTQLVVDAGLTLNGASATIADSGTVTAQALEVFGINTIALPKESGIRNYAMKAGIVLMHPDSSLTLNGEGSLASDFELRWTFAEPGKLQYGHIVINDNASLVNDGGIFRINPGALITINRTNGNVYGSLMVKNGGSIALLGSAGSAHFINRGEVSAYEDGGISIPSGTFTIQGGSRGVLSIASGGVLTLGEVGITGRTTALLTTDNRVDLEDFSTLQLAIDPTAGKNSQLRTSSEISITNFADLNLSLDNDQVLPIGTRFILINYGALTGTGGVAGVANHYFNGYRDGSSFVLGLNRYRINYKDSGDAGFAGAVTLTVVPLVPPVAALTPTPQNVNGTVGASITPSAAMVPSAFGGTVTYSINPALPSGLRFDLVSGVISGVPSVALASTSFTIRGVGSTSGDANATVNLSIAQASQTITFGPAPSATYAPSGGALISASASSGLPITYTSLTPLVCSAGGGSVQMVGAGICTIAANQAGNANYNAATQVTQTVNIAKASAAPLTLLATSANINVSAPPPTTSTLSTSGGSGTGAITVALSPASATTCSIAGSTLSGLATGTCTVTATQAADANYNASVSNPVTIQVGDGAQATLTLVASPVSLNVNSTSALSTSGGSGTGAVSYAVNSGPCSVSGATLTATAVGQCQIVATKAASDSFGATTSNPVTLTVKRLAPPALILSASPASVGFGGTSTLSTTGGISGGAVSYSISGPCAVAGNTLTGTSSGVCVVTASQTETAVYNNASSNTVAVTVKERSTTFTYPTATAIVGQSFTLTPTAVGFSGNARFAVLYSSLPPGLSLNPTTGVISGVPTGEPGVIDLVISVFDNNAYDAALVVVTVQAVPASIPTLSEWGMILLSVLLALAAFGRIRNLPASAGRK
jgi:hypothetical protein